MSGSNLWEVHLYAPAETRPASTETFGGFAPALAYALTLKRDRSNGWHVHVQPPPYAAAAEIEKLRENALYPG
ncbi:MAG TPA: hypothetical protein VL899_06800 [Alphaproteobacteria bacterium]|nr:hypothetical protein [Alphaproteobacteria bacterium]